MIIEERSKGGPLPRCCVTSPLAQALRARILGEAFQGVLGAIATSINSQAIGPPSLKRMFAVGGFKVSLFFNLKMVKAATITLCGKTQKPQRSPLATKGGFFSRCRGSRAGRAGVSVISRPRRDSLSSWFTKPHSPKNGGVSPKPPVLQGREDGDTINACFANQGCCVVCPAPLAAR